MTSQRCSYWETVGGILARISAWTLVEIIHRHLNGMGTRLNTQLRKTIEISENVALGGAFH